jgi:hypothetical protein
VLLTKSNLVKVLKKLLLLIPDTMSIVNPHRYLSKVEEPRLHDIGRDENCSVLATFYLESSCCGLGT